ncbi:MAG: uracil-DNA glycosylase [Acidimicrobiales bacterium]
MAALNEQVVACRACPRLVAWRERVAEEKRASFADQRYWGRPVPGFGDPGAGVVIVGLAPAAHGANRTGRMFTGDRSGDWLFASLWRTGFANQATSVSADDGLALTGAYITAAVRCAPPANQPTPAERDTCQPYLERELALLSSRRAIVALGHFGHDAVCRVLGLRPKPRFGHGAEHRLVDGRFLLGCYHPSQQNTFTRTLTEEMIDAVFSRARELCL